MGNLKLSIITINYNNEEGLKKTIDSIVNQSWQEFEYIVIDGGSDAAEVALIENCPRVDYWVSETDNGVYNAMNKGIRQATGDFIIFMNSGDYFYKDNVLENTKCHFTAENNIIYGNSVYFNATGYRREETPPVELSFHYMMNFGINHQASFIRRELFHEHFFYNEEYKICSDWEFFIYTICHKSVSYLHTNSFICYYDFSGISADPKNLDTYYEERQKTIEKFFPLFHGDYQVMNQLNSKRVRQLLYIKEHVVGWRFIKWFMDFVLIFLPSFKKNDKYNPG
ncbi:glycosyltransferase family 2 protein [Flavobacterium kingsejongi]|uniref:Glycosyltransferase 2-like domain-containing protein n=1 Tax=Flavobacterium kingsejongi TaxID=1678728 RepID=A0A2S1LQ96_9FLAO|nr:glycosyltransferase family 2 protein [Flavobacterium kingsejongi]AWG25930.1 hypothetical protein FK004_12205 [Flavobacterium kingsejongi]